MGGVFDPPIALARCMGIVQMRLPSGELPKAKHQAMLDEEPLPAGGPRRSGRIPREAPRVCF